MLYIFAMIVAVAARTDCPDLPSHTSTYMAVVHGEIDAAELFLPVYSFDAGCNTTSNQKMRQIWLDSEYDLTGFDCDYIVDIAGVPGLPDGVGREIVGNKIPAAARWNRQMGSLCWRDIEVEKRRIYGDNIVDAALDAVFACAGEPRLAPNPESARAPESVQTPNSLNPAGLITAIVASIILVVIIPVCTASMVFDQHRRAQTTG